MQHRRTTDYYAILEIDSRADRAAIETAVKDKLDGWFGSKSPVQWA